MNPKRANEYETVLTAAVAYHRGEHIYARTMLAPLDDPLADALALIGVLLTATAYREREANDAREN